MDGTDAIRQGGAAKILVGMSGGVDSSVVALLLKRAGHAVVGATMKVWDGPGLPEGACGNSSACYGPGEDKDIEAAKDICAGLGIEHITIDLSPEYKREVIGSFREGYLSGRTPNPCVRCNRVMKFGLLVEFARKAGMKFDHFATGHYARVALNPQSGLYELRRPADASKDQSYFLSGLSQEQLSMALFPLGSMMKSEVFELARQAGWAKLADKPESQDFIEGDYATLFNGSEMKPGPIVDASGKVIGRHGGLPAYTVGQRKGLGVGGLKEPLYVVGKDISKNALVAGARDDLQSSGAKLASFNWVSCAPRTEPFKAVARLRSSHFGVEAEVEPAADGGMAVRFSKPQFAVAPGQTLALYDGDLLLGGGEMTEAIR